MGFGSARTSIRSQLELQTVASRYRALHIPVDNIVQELVLVGDDGEMKWNGITRSAGADHSLHKEHFI